MGERGRDRGRREGEGSRGERGRGIEGEEERGREREGSRGRGRERGIEGRREGE